MSTIATVDQLETLPAGASITVKPVGSAAQRYSRETDGWRDTKGSARLIPSRWFRGAVDAGTVNLTMPGEEEEEITDPNEWVAGGWYQSPHDSSISYLAFDADTSGRVHNVMQINSSRAAKSVITQDQITRGDFKRVTEEEAKNHYTDWWWSTLAALNEAKTPAVSADLVDAVREYAFGETDGVLCGILQEHGVDVSVPTTGTVKGTSSMTAEQVAAILGGEVIVGAGIESNWEKEFEVKVQRGCICDKPWEEVVVNPNAVYVNLPANRASFEVSLICREHQNKG